MVRVLWDKRKLKGFEPGLYYSQREVKLASDRIPVREEIVFLESKIFMSNSFIRDLTDLYKRESIGNKLSMLMQLIT